MTEFNVGDRVRILDLPTTVAYAGRVGAVALVKRYGNQAVFRAVYGTLCSPFCTICCKTKENRLSWVS